MKCTGYNVGVLVADITGPSHAEVTAQTHNIPFLACLPIEHSIAILCDQGKVEDCQIPYYLRIGYLSKWMQ